MATSMASVVPPAPDAATAAATAVATVVAGSLMALHAQPLHAIHQRAARTSRKRTRSTPASDAATAGVTAKATATAASTATAAVDPDAPVRTKRKYVRVKVREFVDPWFARTDKNEREVRLGRWLKLGAPMPRHLRRVPPALPPVVRPRNPDIAARVEAELVKVYVAKCKCGACHRLRFAVPTRHGRYVCRMTGCHETFRDVTTFINHQVDAHATVNVHCKRTREEFFRTEDDAVFYPPETVYIASQFANVTEPPVLWTLARVERERETLDDRLAALRKGANTRLLPKHFIRLSFATAYERVQRYGLAELREQHRIALEYFESALVFPVGPRNRQDVVSSVRVGRNWLLSPEPENAALARVLQLERRGDVKKPRWAKATIAEKQQLEDDESDVDEDEEDDEVVLFEFRRPTTHDKLRDRDGDVGVGKTKGLTVRAAPVKKKAQTTTTHLHRPVEASDAICL